MNGITEAIPQEIDFETQWIKIVWCIKKTSPKLLASFLARDYMQ